MKSLYLRSGLALLCAVILSACGGSSNGDLPLQVNVVGLTKSGLVLVNVPTGEKVTVLPGTTIASFTKLLRVDEQFEVKIETPAAGATCTMSENTGKANVYTYNRIVVTCAANPWTLGGNVLGLTGKGLVLANGSDTVAVLPPAVANASIAFTFPTTVGDGSPFGATVLVQPEGQSCSVNPKNNPGTMPGANKLDLEVNCVNK